MCDSARARFGVRSRALIEPLGIVAILWIGLACSSICHTTYAQSSPRSFVSLYWENDVFNDTDQSYTNGVRVSWAYPLSPDAGPWWDPGVFGELFYLDCRRDSRRCWRRFSGWVAGQTMYTPQDITIPTVIPDDRPYGGWLYLSKQAIFARPHNLSRPAMQHSFEAAVGLLGPLSAAEQTQTFVHRYISPASPEPEGWAHQIKTEPGVVLRYGGKVRALELIWRGKRLFDVLPTWEGVAGNVFTYAQGGGMLRAGWHLGDDFGLSRIEPVAALMGQRSRFEAYVFGGVMARAVAHNIFLNGSLLRGGAPTVSREPLVADIEGGVFVRVRGIAASFRWVRRTPEFKERRIYQEYGAWNITLLY